MAAIAWHAFKSGKLVARGLNPAFSTPQPLRASIHHDCDYVIVQNVLTNPDGTQNNAKVFVGAQAVQPYELRPGDMTKPIPVTNVAEIWYADPLGAVFPIVLPAVAPYGEDFPLGNIVFDQGVCTGGEFDFFGIAGGERLIQYHDFGIPQSQGAHPNTFFDISNTGTVEFRFPDNDASALVRVNYTVNPDCLSLSSGPCISRGFEILKDGAGVVSFVSREGAVTAQTVIGVNVGADVWRITLRLGRALFFRNDVQLLDSGLLVPAQVASGAAMTLFVRVDKAPGLFGRVALRRWGLSASQ